MNDAPFIPAWLDDARLDPYTFRVLCHLWRRRNTKTRACYPSVASIAKACGLDRKTVFKAIKQIESANLLGRSKTTFRGSNHYDLRTPTVPSDGTIGTPQPSRQTVHQSSHETVRQPSLQTVHQGSPSESTPIKGVCGKADGTPTPAFLSEVQAEFPDKDVPEIWQEMREHYASKPHCLTKTKLRKWCRTEFDKPAAKKAPTAALPFRIGFSTRPIGDGSPPVRIGFTPALRTVPVGPGDDKVVGRIS